MSTSVHRPYIKRLLSRCGSCFYSITTALSLCSYSSIALAADANGTQENPFWNFIILLIVFSTVAGSAVLNVASLRQWNRNWGLVSALPLFGLVLWVANIVIARQLDPETHALWQLEIFAWAMINMIYMVTAMTAKRMFAKRDAEDPS